MEQARQELRSFLQEAYQIEGTGSALVKTGKKVLNVIKANPVKSTIAGAGALGLGLGVKKGLKPKTQVQEGKSAFVKQGAKVLKKFIKSAPVKSIKAGASNVGKSTKSFFKSVGKSAPVQTLKAGGVQAGKDIASGASSLANAGAKTVSGVLRAPGAIARGVGTAAKVGTAGVGGVAAYKVGKKIGKEVAS